MLFDVDGTLVDSNYQQTVSWWQAFRMADVTVLASALHRAIGMGSDHLIPHVLGEMPDSQDVDAEVVSAAHDAIFSTHWGSLTALPAAADLLRRCHEAGLQVVLASSAKERELAVLRAALDADDWIDTATSSADADGSKPEPDLIEVALSKAGLAPRDAVYVGDSVWDMQAATTAGVRCVGLECGGTSADELRRAGAAATYRDPAELLDRFTDSPLAP